MHFIYQAISGQINHVKVIFYTSDLPASTTALNLPLIISSTEDAGFPADGSLVYSTPASVPPWCPDSGDSDPSLQVDLGFVYLVTGFTFTSQTNLTSFKLDISMDGATWTSYTDYILGDTVSTYDPIMFKYIL